MVNSNFYNYTLFTLKVSVIFIHFFFDTCYENILLNK